MVHQKRASCKILIVLPTGLVDNFTQLIEAYTERHISVNFLTFNKLIPDGKEIVKAAGEHSSVMVVGPANRSPRTVLKRPFLTVNEGKKIPIAWLPDCGPEPLSRFVQAAARAHLRKQEVQSIAILGQRHQRYLKLANRMEDILKSSRHAYPVFKWTSDLLLREDMLTGLGSGLGAAIYFGHGRPIGWVGYYGLRKHHFDNFQGSPIGALLSICCQTASRKRTGLSFAEALPLKGVAAATFGAVCDTLHTNNTRWAVGIGQALLHGARNIGELILDSGLNYKMTSSYRIIGDPLAPLYASIDGLNSAGQIKVYP